MLLQVQGIIAEYERTKIRERCRRGRLFAARSGRVSVLGKAPYGYRYVTKLEGGGEARYVVEFAEAQTVQEMFTWCGIEGCSLTQICNRLKEKGIVTRKGKTTWDRVTVLDMLRNPAYMGEARFNKVHTVPARPRLRPRRGAPDYPRRPTAKQPTPLEDQIPIAVPAIVEPRCSRPCRSGWRSIASTPGKRPSNRAICWRAWWCAGRCGYAYRGRVQASREAALLPLLWERSRSVARTSSGLQQPLDPSRAAGRGGVVGRAGVAAGAGAVGPGIRAAVEPSRTNRERRLGPVGVWTS